MMSYCQYEGRAVSPEIAGFCNACSLYLSTCAPIISNGYLMGAECDAFYCENCPSAYECGVGEWHGKEAM